MKLLWTSKQFRIVYGLALFMMAYIPFTYNFIDKNKANYKDDKNFCFDNELVNFLNYNQNIKNDSPVISFEDYSCSLLNLLSLKHPNIERHNSKIIARKDKQQNLIKSGPFKNSNFVTGVIKSNFYVDARSLGIPAKIVDSVIKKLASKINFRHSFNKGDRFEIAFNDKELLYTKIVTKHKEVSLYKYGKEGYFFENGEKYGASKNKNFFGQPIRGNLKISSNYGYRKHPVTGRYSKHTGVDFSTHYGTPIYAVFDGVVTRASRYSGYGNCIDIRHASGYSSRYGHLSRFVVRPGIKVKKGQLIAYSGSSGISTGPHLHLELAKNSVPINPMSVKMLPERLDTVSNIRKFQILKSYCKRLHKSV